MEKAFGDVVRTRREELKITLRKFAASVDISPTYLSKIERGEFPPPGEKKIVAIAEGLGLNADELLGLAGRVPSDVAKMIQKQPIEMASFLRAANKLSPADLEKMVRAVERKIKAED